MRYAQRGGYTPAEQGRREQLRLKAARLFERGEGAAAVAAALRVTSRTVRQWRQQWREGGAEALRSKGPVSRERLSPQQFARLEVELKRIKVLIGRLFHVGYTVQGVWKLMRRHGWTCQVPLRRAVERDEEAIEAWKEEVWPQVKPQRRTWAPTSASRTRRDRA